MAEKPKPVVTKEPESAIKGLRRGRTVHFLEAADRKIDAVVLKIVDKKAGVVDLECFPPGGTTYVKEKVPMAVEGQSWIGSWRLIES